jgi:hypothetical protein
MTTEEHLKILVGDLVFQIALLRSELDKVTEKKNESDKART